MVIIVVPKEQAGQILAALREKNLLDKSMKIGHRESHVLIPILADTFKGYPIADVPLAAAKAKSQSWKEALQAHLQEAELAKLKTAFDQVGTIAIIEIDRVLEAHTNIIANALLRVHPSIRTVLLKGKHEGQFRTQTLTYLAGIDTRETMHIEAGVRMHINVETVYFSVRLSTERQRIAKMIQPHEHVLVLFSGAAPYPCVLAKHNQLSNIVGIEANPAGHELGLKNVAANHLKNVQLYCGDVRTVLPTLSEKFDRILLPLPKGAGEFLDVACQAANSPATIHLYHFCTDKQILANANTLCASFKNFGWNATVAKIVSCGQQSPHTYRYCIDFEIVQHFTPKPS